MHIASSMRPLMDTCHFLRLCPILFWPFVQQQHAQQQFEKHRSVPRLHFDSVSPHHVGHAWGSWLNLPFSREPLGSLMCKMSDIRGKGPIFECITVMLSSWTANEVEIHASALMFLVASETTSVISLWFKDREMLEWMQTKSSCGVCCWSVCGLKVELDTFANCRPIGSPLSRTPKAAVARKAIGPPNRQINS